MFSTQPLLMKNKCRLWDDDTSATLLRLRSRAFIVKPSHRKHAHHVCAAKGKPLCPGSEL